MAEELKAAVSVTEMAQMVGLSRDRFYDLVRAGSFPPPLHRLDSRRPHYSKELQLICVQVRHSGIGFDGRIMTFNRTRRSSRRIGPPPSGGIKSFSKPAAAGRLRQLLKKLGHLGLRRIDVRDLEQAMGVCWPSGIDTTEEAIVLHRLVQYFASAGA